MSTFDELTEIELRRFLALGVEYEHLRGLNQTALLRLLGGDSGTNWVVPVIEDCAAIFMKNHLVEEAKRITANSHNIKRWADCGYVDLVPAAPLFTKFVITPHGHALIDHQGKPALLRRLID